MRSALGNPSRAHGSSNPRRGIGHLQRQSSQGGPNECEAAEVRLPRWSPPPSLAARFQESRTALASCPWSILFSSTCPFRALRSLRVCAFVALGADFCFSL
eukprot:3114855-Pyramimonas_sp.AAC.1